MKTISLIVVIVTMLMFAGCSSKGVELEKSPCACNYVTSSQKV